MQRGPEDLKEIQETKEQRERRAQEESKATKVHKGQLERRANKETPDHLVKMVLTDSREQLAIRDLRVLSVIPVMLARKERMATKVQRV